MMPDSFMWPYFASAFLRLAPVYYGLGAFFTWSLSWPKLIPTWPGEGRFTLLLSLLLFAFAVAFYGRYLWEKAIDKKYDQQSGR